MQIVYYIFVELLTINYTYNAAAQFVSMTAANRLPVNYSYDTAGRLSTIAQGNETFTYGYDVLSRRIRLARPNGVTTNYTWDQVNRLERLQHVNAAQIALEDFQYSYTLDDEISAINSLVATPPLPAAKTAGTADAANRISQFGNASYSFDATGQTTSKTDGNGTTSYQWDARGRLTKATLPNNQNVTYGYDALGRRASRTANGATTTFLYDGYDVVLDQAGNAVQAEYLNGPGVDDKLRQTSGLGNLYFLTDHLGSTSALTNSTGGVVERQSYDPFGGSGGSALTRYGYTGREREEATGLLYYRARWYDAEQGRFVTEDPIGIQGGANLYAYVGNNPLSGTDPLGLTPKDLAPEIDAATNDTESRVKSIPGVQRYDDFAVGWNHYAPPSLSLPSVSGAADAVRNYTDWLRLGSSTAYFCGDAWEVLEAAGQDARRVSDIILTVIAVAEGLGALGKGIKPPCPLCFTAGTEVILADGSGKSIETIKVNDVVLSADQVAALEAKAETKPQNTTGQVSQLFSRVAPAVLDIALGSDKITVTPEHEFWVSGEGWQEAKELWVGAKLLTKDGKEVKVEWIGKRAGEFRVYNFEVANSHTYFVGKMGVLVHNNNCGWDLPAGRTTINGREYSTHALERMAPRTPQVMAELERRALERAANQGLKPGTKEFSDFMKKNGPDPRGIPPSVVEAEIANPGTTGVTVITDTTSGRVVTVIPKKKI